MWRVLVGTSTQISSRSFISHAAQEMSSGVWVARPCAVPSTGASRTPQRLRLMPSVSAVLRGLRTDLAPPASAVGSSTWCLLLFSLLTAPQFGFRVANRRAVLRFPPYFIFLPHYSPFSSHNKSYTEGFLCIEYLF